MTETKSFMAEVEQEGRMDQPAKDHEEKDTPADSPPEKKTEEDKPDPSTGDKGEDAPESKPDEPKVFEAFHNHPRWKALQGELSELREFREKALPLLEDLQKKPDEKITEIPEWFAELFGENDVAWKKYQTYSKTERDDLRREIREELHAESAKVSEETKKWDKWVDSEIASLESDPDVQADLKKSGISFNRNEVLKTAIDYRPSGEDGNISIKLAFDIWKKMKLFGTKPADDKKSADDKKKVAAQTMGKGAGDGERKDYKTSHDLAGKSFRDLIPDE